MAYPYVACVIVRKRATRASRSRKPCVNRGSESKVIAIGSWRERRKNWLEPILQPALAQLSLILIESEGSKWLKSCAIPPYIATNEWQFVISRLGPVRAKLLAKDNSGDYQDFVGKNILLIINSTISFIEENNAGSAAAVLMPKLAPKANVFLKDN
ncbi:hypothetical protein PIB30_042029 [Stylosanthes scabra]|uniref:Uncharacterized protein n=1 Tax=Stylosanthes scabra TaxID=79078 RepID=A0ABU6UEW1_9FABA|nr:hypothetical protein [Stylosanthes scabra]